MIYRANRGEVASTTRRKTAIIIAAIALCVVILLPLGLGTLRARAEDPGQQQHTINFTQAELARLIENALFGAIKEEPDFSHLNGQKVVVSSGDSTPVSVDAEDAYKAFVLEKLEGHLFLGTYVEPGNSVVYLAMDGTKQEDISLIAVGVNLSAGKSQFTLDLEKRAPMASEIVVYNFENTVPQTDGQDTSSQPQAPVSSEDTSAVSSLPASVPDEEDASSVAPASQPEDAASAASLPEDEAPSGQQPSSEVPQPLEADAPVQALAGPLAAQQAAQVQPNSNSAAATSNPGVEDAAPEGQTPESMPPLAGSESLPQSEPVDETPQSQPQSEEQPVAPAEPGAEDSLTKEDIQVTQEIELDANMLSLNALMDEYGMFSARLHTGLIDGGKFEDADVDFVAEPEVESGGIMPMAIIGPTGPSNIQIWNSGAGPAASTQPGNYFVFEEGGVTYSAYALTPSEHIYIQAPERTTGRFRIVLCNQNVPLTIGAITAEMRTSIVSIESRPVMQDRVAREEATGETNAIGRMPPYSDGMNTSMYKLRVQNDNPPTINMTSGTARQYSAILAGILRVDGVTLEAIAAPDPNGNSDVTWSNVSATASQLVMGRRPSVSGVGAAGIRTAYYFYATNRAQVYAEGFYGIASQQFMVLDDGYVDFLGAPAANYATAADVDGNGYPKNLDKTVVSGVSTANSSGGKMPAGLSALYVVPARGSLLYAKGPDGIRFSDDEDLYYGYGNPGNTNNVNSGLPPGIMQQISRTQMVAFLLEHMTDYPEIVPELEETMGGTVIAKPLGTNDNAGVYIKGNVKAADNTQASVLGGINLREQKLFVDVSDTSGGNIYGIHGENAAMAMYGGSQLITYGMNRPGIDLRMNRYLGDGRAIAINITDEASGIISATSNVLAQNLGAGAAIVTNEAVHMTQGRFVAIAGFDTAAYQLNGGYIPQNRETFYVPDPQYFEDGWMYPSNTTNDASVGIQLIAGPNNPSGTTRVRRVYTHGDGAQVFAFGGATGMDVVGDVQGQLIYVEGNFNPAARVVVKAFGGKYGIRATNRVSSIIGVESDNPNYLSYIEQAQYGPYILGAGPYNGIKVTSNQPQAIFADVGWVVGETMIDRANGVTFNGSSLNAAAINSDAGAGLSVGGGISSATRTAATIHAERKGTVEEMYHGFLYGFADDAGAFGGSNSAFVELPTPVTAGDLGVFSQIPQLVSNIGYYNEDATAHPNFLWTTPTAGPRRNYSTHYDFTGYDAADTMGYTGDTAVTNTGRLTVNHDIPSGVPLVADNQRRAISPSAGGGNVRYFSAANQGTVRVVIYPTAQPKTTINVKVNVMGASENDVDNATQLLTPVLNTVEYELRYTPVGGGAVQNVTYINDTHSPNPAHPDFNRATGVIDLKKLRAGRYELWQSGGTIALHKDLPLVAFDILLGPADFEISLVSPSTADPTISTDGHIRIKDAGSAILGTNFPPDDGISPTFSPADARPARTKGEIDIIHFRDDVTFSFYKVDERNPETVTLPGAEFTLYKCVSTAAGHQHMPNRVVLVTDATLAAGDCWQLVTTATSGADGLVEFTGLTTGVYTLVETKAPSGYERPAGQWEFTVDTSLTTGKVSTPLAKGAPTPPAFRTGTGGVMQLPNRPPLQLPMAGSVGKYPFVASGILLLLGSCIALFIKRRAIMAWLYQSLYTGGDK